MVMSINEDDEDKEESVKCHMMQCVTYMYSHSRWMVQITCIYIVHVHVQSCTYTTHLTWISDLAADVVSSLEARRLHSSDN